MSVDSCREPHQWNPIAITPMIQDVRSLWLPSEIISIICVLAKDVAIFLETLGCNPIYPGALLVLRSFAQFTWFRKSLVSMRGVRECVSRRPGNKYLFLPIVSRPTLFQKPWQRNAKPTHIKPQDVELFWKRHQTFTVNIWSKLTINYVRAIHNGFSRLACEEQLFVLDAHLCAGHYEKY